VVKLLALADCRSWGESGSVFQAVCDCAGSVDEGWQVTVDVEELCRAHISTTQAFTPRRVGGNSHRTKAYRTIVKANLEKISTVWVL
jgi:hypothetical protein